MENLIFNTVRDGVDFCIKNYNGKECRLDFVSDDPENDKPGGVGFYPATDGVYEQVLSTIGPNLCSKRCKFVWSRDFDQKIPDNQGCNQ